jgi:hypothetical protein
MESSIRRNAAELVWEVRRMFPTLVGEWTRREWNAQCRSAGRSYINNITRFYAANQEN